MHAQVGNYTLERAMWQRPEDMRNRRPVYYVATKNGAPAPSPDRVSWARGACAGCEACARRIGHGGGVLFCSCFCAAETVDPSVWRAACGVPPLGRAPPPRGHAHRRRARCWARCPVSLASQACSLSKSSVHPLSGPPRRAGTSDLVGQMVGALVSTALVFEDADAPYYERLMSQALALYGAGMHRRGKYSDVFLYDCAPLARTLP